VIRALSLFLLLLLFACEVKPEPEPIRYGKDACAWCRMIIADAGFAAELKTKKGKVYKFDAPECLAAFVLSGQIKKDEILGMWVADFAQKGKLIPVEQAKFLVSEKIKSPMGLNIAAFSSEEDLEEAKRVFGGRVLTWEEVLQYVKERWGDQLHRHHTHHSS